MSHLLFDMFRKKYHYSMTIPSVLWTQKYFLKKPENLKNENYLIKQRTICGWDSFREILHTQKVKSRFDPHPTPALESLVSFFVNFQYQKISFFTRQTNFYNIIVITFITILKIRIEDRWLFVFFKDLH